MRKILVLLAMVLPALISCGGGGGGGPAADVVQVPTVSASLLTSCVGQPKPVDQLLGCLAGKVSLGKDVNGAACSVKFSTDGLDIFSLLLNRNVVYRPTNASAQDMSYGYERSYSPDTGALSFTVTALNTGAPYFNFGFSGNTKTGGGTALFDFTLSPEVAGAPGVTLQCTMQL
jgi:hypothetical protein